MPTAVAVCGVRRYTCHGGGPAEGALYSAVSANPVSSARAGQPSAAQRVARAATVGRVGDQGSLARYDEVELPGRHAERAARIPGEVLALAGVHAGLEPEAAVGP